MLTKVGESYMKIMSTIRYLTPQPILTTADTTVSVPRGIHVQVFESRSNQTLDTFGVSSNLQRYLFVGFGLPNAALVCLDV